MCETSVIFSKSKRIISNVGLHPRLGLGEMGDWFLLTFTYMYVFLMNTWGVGPSGGRQGVRTPQGSKTFLQNGPRCLKRETDAAASCDHRSSAGPLKGSRRLKRGTDAGGVL